MMAPRAAAPTATVIIHPENQPRMMISLSFIRTLLQWIRFDAHKVGGVIFCRRIRTSSLRKSEVLRTRSQQQGRKGIVPFHAARLVINLVLPFALFRELLFDGPRPRPYGWILDRNDIFERS